MKRRKMQIIAFFVRQDRFGIAAKRFHGMNILCYNTDVEIQEAEHEKDRDHIRCRRDIVGFIR